MLDQFQVRDFKSLVDVTVDLGVVNVFIGANGSGKSNLLEAVGILGAAASGHVNDESLKYRGVRPGLPALYKSSFKRKSAAQHIRFGAQGFEASYDVSLLNPIQNPTPDWAFKHEKLVRDSRIRLFAVDRNKRGFTVIHRVEVNNSLLKSAEKGIPLSQQWVMGHFGGVPSGV